MTSKRTKIVKDLDPQDVKGFSKARIEHYLRLGYKPYLDENSEVKWLTEASRNMREAGHKHPSLASRFAARNAYKKQRRHLRRGGVFGFFRAYWPFILTLAVIAGVLTLLLLYPQILI